MKLYHYSNNEVNKLKTSYYGNNYYTSNDTKVCSVPRLFFYKNLKHKERYFNSASFLYETNVNDRYIYDLRKDKLRLLNKFTSIDNLLKRIKSLKYKGIIYESCGIEIVNLFYDVKIDKKIRLN